MPTQFQEECNRHFADRGIEMRREIAEDRQKIAQRKLRQAILETWIEQSVPSLF